MLKIEIPGQEMYNEETNEFITTKGAVLQLEHSLVSLSRWESITHKPFLVEHPEKTEDEIRLYVQCMTITQNVDPEVYKCLTKAQIKQVLDYIDDPMTATWFKNDNKKSVGNSSGEIVTSEYLYYLMIEMDIPPEYQKWHLNRLMTLMRIISVKSKNNSKMSRKDQMQQYSALKAARRKPKV